MANVTQIDSGYLTGFKNELQGLLDQVNQQIRGIGYGDPSTTMDIKPVNGSLQIVAGAASFPAATDLNAALKAMGGTVQSQLQWLQKVFTDAIAETTKIITGFHGSEALNKQTVAQLQQEYYATINDLSSPPGSTTTGGPTTPPGG